MKNTSESDPHSCEATEAKKAKIQQNLNPLPQWYQYYITYQSTAPIPWSLWVAIFLGILCKCLSCFTTARITFTCVNNVVVYLVLVSSLIIACCPHQGRLHQNLANNCLFRQIPSSPFTKAVQLDHSNFVGFFCLWNSCSRKQRNLNNVHLPTKCYMNSYISATDKSCKYM